MHRGVKPCCAACRIVSKDQDQGPGTNNCEDCKGHGWLRSWDSCSKNSNGLEFRHLFSTGCWESSAKSKKGSGSLGLHASQANQGGDQGPDTYGPASPKTAQALRHQGFGGDRLQEFIIR